MAKPAIQLPIEPSEPLHPALTEPGSSSAPPTPPQGPVPPKAPHAPSFDLALARISLGLEAICYTLIPLAPSPAAFTLFSVLASFGAGFGPAAQSLALALFARRGEVETGRLFGALSVVQSIWCVPLRALPPRAVPGADCVCRVRPCAARRSSARRCSA